MALDLTTRKGWGARTTRIGRPMGQVSKLVVHHFWRPDVPASASRATERSVMRGVEGFHASKGWSAAPGYTFVVFDSGRVYQSTGWGRQGVHTAGINSVSIAFCFGIDGDAADATPRAWQAMTDLAALAVAQGHLTANYNLYGHRDFSAKSCPGNRVYPHIGRVRSGITLPEEDEMWEINPSSASHHIGMYQRAMVWHGTQLNLPEAVDLKVDRVWGDKTERAHIAVMGATLYTARTKGRVMGPDFMAVIHACPDDWFTV